MTSDSSQRSSIKETGTSAEFIERCLHLASLGAGYTAPNPLVGAVLVHEGRIIGEGFHEKYGEAHAEVNCVRSVHSADRHLISSATLYVSLEPCCHHGKTPPCTDLIIGEKIPRVVIGCRDPYPAVNGKGIEKLRAHGIVVEGPVLEEAAREMNHRFFTFHEKKRPYIILKWAESADRKIAGPNGKRISISNDYSNRLVHKWRSEEASILVGTRTALLDDPQLTTRLWSGQNPVRIVVDRNLRLPDTLKLFDGSQPTIILNETTDLSAGKRLFKKIEAGPQNISSILTALHAVHMISVIVEGGGRLLQSFMDEGIWDELRIITNTGLSVPDGISAPEIRNAHSFRSEEYGTDLIRYFKPS